MPKLADACTLTHHDVNGGTRLRGSGERLHRPFSPHIKLRDVANQCYALDPSSLIAASVKRTSIERTHQSVVTNEPRHVNIVQRLGGKKFQRFRFLPFEQWASFEWSNRGLIKRGLYGWLSVETRKECHLSLEPRR